jgi:hypothetical protein
MSETSSGGLLAGLDAYGRRRIVQVVATLFISIGLIFLIAGRLDFVWGWVYLAVALACLAVGAAYVLRHNPQAINERGRPAEGQKSWDKIIIAIYLPLYIGVYLVCGLDARFGWSQMPLWLHLLGVGLTVAATRSPLAGRTATCATRCTPGW